MRVIGGLRRLRGSLIAVVAAGVLLGGGHASPAAEGVFSLDRLRLGSVSGPENYVFSAGDVVFPEGGADAGTYYMFVVTDVGGVTRNPAFACTPAASFSSNDNSYTIQATDPVSTGTSWRFTLQQFTNATCSGTPAKTAFKSLYVASAQTFGDANLSTPTSVFGSSGTAYMTIAGVKPSINDWSTTWILPSGSVACANTAANDRPDASNTGALPKPGGSYMQYKPWTTQNGSSWNRESNYETAPCPGFAGNDGVWKLKVQLDATNFVVVPAFTVDATPPPAPTFLSGPSGPTASTTATFEFDDAESGVTYLCRLDSGSFVACSSPQSYTGLSEGNHSLELKAVDAAGNQSAITPRTWTVHTSAPPAPTITSGPSGRTTSSSATFAFTDTDPGATFRCRLDGGGFSACTSPHSYSGLAEGSHTFDVVAVDAAGNQSAATSRTWIVDTQPPTVTITSGPTGTTSSTSATFTFTADEADSTFECKLDDGAYAACTSPKTYSELANGSHTFSVRGTDLGGSTSAPATRDWTVDAIDTTAPTATITGSPANPTNQTVAAFSFGASEPGSTFQCRLDGGAYGDCTSPKSYTGLGEGEHTFDVTATDGAGNTGPPASFTWTVDTTAPVVTITGHPSDPSNTGNPSFTFGADEGGISFVCRLDGGGFSACSSPQAYTGLSDGTHTFDVRGVDAAGNTGAPASSTWTIDTAAPAVTLTAPANGSSSSNQTPTFAGAAGTASGDAAGVMVKIYAGSTATGTPVQTLLATHSGGVYSVPASPPLADGTYTARSEQVDAAGNVGLSTANTFTIAPADTTPPVVTLVAPADGSTTSSSLPTFSGTGGTAPGDLATVTVRVYAGSSATGTPLQTLTTSRAADTGAYSVPASSGLTGGTYTAQAEQADAAGNVGTSSANTFTVSSPYGSTILAHNPRGYWRLGEASGSTAADETGTNPGTYQNGVVLGQAGALGTDDNTAASFDGVNDIVTVPSSASLNATTAVTMEAWVKRTRSGAWQNIIAKPGSGTAAAQNYALWINTLNQPVAYFGNGTSTVSATSTTALDTNWHYVAATYDNATAKIYLDGVLKSSVNSTVQLTTSTGSLVIGRTTDNVRIFGGVLDEVAVYGTALTATQLQAHYNAGTALDTTPPAVTLTTPPHGATTDEHTPTFSGAAGVAPGDLPAVTVKVYSGSSATGTPIQTLTTNQSGGSWSVNASSALAEGMYTARAEQADTASNVGLSAPNSFTVTSADITGPAVTLTMPADGSSGSDTTPTLSGSAGTAAGDLPTITVKIWTGLSPSGTPLQTLIIAASGGSWSGTASELPQGTYAARAEQDDDAGNIGLSSPHTFTIGAAYADEVLADNPGGYWRLGEASGTTATDQTGTNPGTYQNGVVLRLQGALTADTNTAASFDGVDDIVTVPSSTSLNATTGVTVEAWVKRTRSGAWQNIIAKPGSGAAAAQNYALWINTLNQPVAYFGNGSSTVSATATTALDTNWHHVAATYNNATARMYVDGVLKASVNATVQLTANTGALVIGRSTDNVRIFGGTLDEPAVYRTALSATRIQLHYQKGTAIDTVAPVVTLTTPVAGSSTLNRIPHFAGGASTTGTDSTTVTVKVYTGTTPTGSPIQTLDASWFTSGAWSVDASAALPLGTYTAQAQQTDLAGNVGTSAPNTFTIVAPSSSPDPLMAGAGDIADCTDTGVNATANLILGLPASTTVFTVGDNAYPQGSASDFSNCYEPTWGQFKSRTRPAIGDHEYETPNASGYFNYFQTQLAPFGASATDPNRAYYSYDIGAWHVVVLNGACADAPACSATAQASWLDADLAAHSNQCTFAILAAPRWSSGSVHGSNATMGQYFAILYDNGADFVLGGDDHLYERFAPQDPQGFYDPGRGVRQFVAGTGGGSLYTFASPRANSEVRRSGNYGILKLTLHAGSYEWEFVPTSGTFSDSGTTSCH
jgi:hypothetical protein